MVNIFKLVGVSIKVIGVEGKITDLFYWDTVIGKNFIKTLITIPQGCWNEGSLTESSTSQVILIIAFLTLNSDIVTSNYVAFSANVGLTFLTKPLKRFVLFKDVKLRFSQICAFQVIPFVAIIT